MAVKKVCKVLVLALLLQCLSLLPAESSEFFEIILEKFLNVPFYVKITSDLLDSKTPCLVGQLENGLNIRLFPPKGSGGWVRNESPIESVCRVEGEPAIGSDLMLELRLRHLERIDLWPGNSHPVDIVVSNTAANIDFEEIKLDIEPEIVGGSLFVSLGTLEKIFFAKTSIEFQNRYVFKINISGIKIEIMDGDLYANVFDKRVKMNAEAYYDEVPFLPLRFFLDFFKLTYVFNQKTKTLTFKHYFSDHKRLPTWEPIEICGKLVGFYAKANTITIEEQTGKKWIVPIYDYVAMTLKTHGFFKLEGRRSIGQGNVDGFDAFKWTPYALPLVNQPEPLTLAFEVVSVDDSPEVPIATIKMVDGETFKMLFPRPFVGKLLLVGECYLASCYKEPEMYSLIYIKRTLPKPLAVKAKTVSFTQWKKQVEVDGVRIMLDFYPMIAPGKDYMLTLEGLRLLKFRFKKTDDGFIISNDRQTIQCFYGNKKVVANGESKDLLSPILRSGTILIPFSLMSLFEELDISYYVNEKKLTIINYCRPEDYYDETFCGDFNFAPNMAYEESDLRVVRSPIYGYALLHSMTKLNSDDKPVMYRLNGYKRGPIFVMTFFEGISAEQYAPLEHLYITVPKEDGSASSINAIDFDNKMRRLFLSTQLQKVLKKSLSYFLLCYRQEFDGGTSYYLHNIQEELKRPTSYSERAIAFNLSQKLYERLSFVNLYAEMRFYQNK